MIRRRFQIGGGGTHVNTPLYYYSIDGFADAVGFKLLHIDLLHIERLAGYRYRYLQSPSGMQHLGERGRLLWLSMDQEDAAQRRRQRLDPLQQFALIGVPAQFIKARNLRPHPLRLA